MRKYKYEITLFVMNAVAMSLELVASRILAPYFGNSYIVWTCIIGIILLSNSIGNYLGGKLADKEEVKKSANLVLKYMIIMIAALIFTIALSHTDLFSTIKNLTKNVRVGSILSTISLFLLPNIIIGMLSPMILKIKLSQNGDKDETGKIGGNVYAIGTVGSIVGTFASGFILFQIFGSNNILFLLVIVCILNSILLIENNNKKELAFYILFIIIISVILGLFIYLDNNISRKILLGEIGPELSLDTQYGSVRIRNLYSTTYNRKVRFLEIEGGAESYSFIDEDNKYEIIPNNYMDYYNKCLAANSDSVKDMLLIGGAGYSFPKYVISHYPEKNIDVVEIDEKITEVAKKYFDLDDLIEEYDLDNNHRLNIIHNDGRLYMENNQDKKYDLILNDAFIGKNPVKTLTTLECASIVKSNLKENGYYIINIISAFEGDDSGFAKAEVKTLKNVFKNVYTLRFNANEKVDQLDNMIIVATDGTFECPDSAKFYDFNYSDGILLTDNFCPIESIYHVE